MARRQRAQPDTIYNEDCVRGMDRIEDGTVDLIVTDPPFGIGFGAGRRANYNRTASRVLEGYGEVDAGRYYAFSLAWMRQAHRVLKDSGSMYVFSGWNNLKDVLAAIDDAGFETVNHIVWKYQFGVYTSKRYVTSHYTIPYVCKDPRKRRFYPYARFGKGERGGKGGKGGKGGSLHYRDKEDVWDIKREYWRGEEKTPTKLPAEIVAKMLAYSTVEGDLVLDPFMGSGQVAVVARRMGRRFMGFEVSKRYCGLARRRVDEERAPSPYPLMPRRYSGLARRRVDEEGRDACGGGGDGSRGAHGPGRAGAP